LFHGFILVADELSLDDGLDGRVEKGDVGDRGVSGDVGELSGMGGLLGASHEVLTCGALGRFTVLIEAPSSSSIPANVDRSEYEFRVEFTRVIPDRIVSVSELELIVDIVRNDAILDALPEPECEDAAIPLSCLCAPQ
jgi:hypothetical protein